MARKIQLSANAGDEQTEIEVLDGNFNPVPLEHNMGQVDVELSPGVYAVNFRVGDVKTQKLVVLQPDSPTQYVNLDRDEQIKFATSAPLSNTKTQVPSHSENAQRISQLPPTPVDNLQEGGSQLFIFIRNPNAVRSADLCKGVCLHDQEGNLVIDFSASGERSLEESWMGANIELDPGAYRLRVSNEEGGFLEQMIYIRKGWQTQIFLFAMEGGSEGITYRANPFRTSLLMAKVGRGFDPQREDLRWTELSLRALSEGRAVPSKTRSEMLWAKYENPMLGIYAGHLHMRRKSINVELMLQVYDNLLRLVGEHPDVIALGYELVRREPSLRDNGLIKESLSRAGPIVLPPMLRSSWNMLMNATTEDPEIIPRGSLADKAATSNVRYGPWVIWRNSVELENVGTDFDVPMGDQPSLFSKLKSALGEFVSDLAHGTLDGLIKTTYKVCERDPEAVDMVFTDSFTDEERRIIQYIYPKADSTLSIIAESASDDQELSVLIGADAPPSESDLIKTLELPVGTAIRVLLQIGVKWMGRPFVPEEQTLEFFIARESRGNPVLEKALCKLTTVKTGLKNSENGQEINGLEFMYIRYRNPPYYSKRKVPTADDIIAVLERNNYQYDGHTVTKNMVTQVLKQVRSELTAFIDMEVKSGQLNLGENWRLAVLPKVNVSHIGHLLP